MQNYTVSGQRTPGLQVSLLPMFADNIITGWFLSPPRPELQTFKNPRPKWLVKWLPKEPKDELLVEGTE